MGLDLGVGGQGSVPSTSGRGMVGMRGASVMLGWKVEVDGWMVDW